MNESHSDSQEQNPGNYHVTATQPHNTQPAQQQHQRAADRSLRPTFPTNTKKSAPPFALSRPNTTTSYKQGLNPPTGLTGPNTGKTPKTPHHTTPTGHTTTRTPDMQPPPHPGGANPQVTALPCTTFAVNIPPGAISVGLLVGCSTASFVAVGV